MGKGAGIKPEDPGSVFRSPVATAVNRLPQVVLCPSPRVCVVPPPHTALTQDKQMKCIRFLELSEIYLLFKRLATVDIWTTLLKINSHYSLERKRSASPQNGQFPFVLLSCVPRLKGMEETLTRGLIHSLVLYGLPHQKHKSEEQSLLSGLSVVFQNHLDLMPYLNDHAG